MRSSRPKPHQSTERNKLQIIHPPETETHKKIKEKSQFAAAGRVGTSGVLP